AGQARAPLARTLALAAEKEGNDPHNQEIGLCLLEDYGHTSAVDRDTLLLACAHHTAGHVKFGDPLEPYRRFTEALGGGCWPRRRPSGPRPGSSSPAPRSAARGTTRGRPGRPSSPFPVPP